jgi:hypothetical protein
VPHQYHHELARRKKEDLKAKHKNQRKIILQRVLRKEKAHAAFRCCEFAMENAPLHLLKSPKAETAGKSGSDYGQHQQALNYNYHQIDTCGKIQDVRVGSLSIGLSYDGDWKITANRRIRCLQSEKHLDYLQAVKSSLELGRGLIPLRLKPFLETMRVNLLRGPNTRWHTDAFKGVTNNYLLIDDDGKSGSDVGFLSVDRSISFRCSVVRFKDSFYIPVSYSDSNSTLRMVGFGNMAEASYDEGETCKHHATFYLFSSKVFDQLIPYGNLPFAFVGIIKGSLQVVQLQEKLRLFQKPLKFDTVKFHECIAFAKQSPSQTRKSRYKNLGARGKWMVFNAWQFRHRWNGNNLLIRHHVYFRLIRQIATGGNIIAKGKYPNFVECRVRGVEHEGLDAGNYDQDHEDDNDR